MPLPAIVRAATQADVPELAAIEAAADARYAGVGHPELADGSTISEAVARKAVAENRLAVAMISDVLVGWVYWGRVGDELSIAQLCVLPEYGRRGIGTQLLQHVLDHADAAGEPTVVLNTQGDVAWNRPWYEAHGFHVVPEAEWTPAMRAVSRDQRDAGLIWSTRVHMRKAMVRGMAPSTCSSSTSRTRG